MSSARLQKLLLIVALLLTYPAFANVEALRLVVISDINGRYASTEYHPRLAVAIQKIIELKPDIVVSTGDMVAGQRPSPKLQRAELDKLWESFHRHVRTPLEKAGIPLIMTPGNHDASAYPGFELERETYARYHSANPPSSTPRGGGNFPFNFAAEFNGVLLISLDATKTGALDSAQLTWLERELCSRRAYRAKILFGHLPLQPIAIGRENDVIRDPALEALMVAGGTTAYLSGHHHAYYPGVRLGVDMLSMGNLGGNQRRLLGSNITTGFNFALLEIDAAGSIHIEAFSGPDFVKSVDVASLPHHLGTGSGRIGRRDLAQKRSTASPVGNCNTRDS